jgi:hypothetical protein
LLQAKDNGAIVVHMRISKISTTIHLKISMNFFKNIRIYENASENVWNDYSYKPNRWSFSSFFFRLNDKCLRLLLLFNFAQFRQGRKKPLYFRGWTVGFELHPWMPLGSSLTSFGRHSQFMLSGQFRDWTSEANHMV